MEDERFREVIAIIANYSWVRPGDGDESADGREPSAVRADYDKWRPRLRAFRRKLQRENFPKGQRAVQFLGGELRKLWWAEFDRAFCSEFPEWHNAGQFVGGDGSYSLRGVVDDVWWAEFVRAFRREFPEWHWHSYEHSLLGGGTFTVAGHFAHHPIRLQDDLRRVWELASTKKNDEAKVSLLRIKMQSSRRLKKFEEHRQHTNGWEHDKRALGLLVETLEWLQKRLGNLRICKNPKCATGSTYFFRKKNNSKYCCDRCTSRAKALREAERDAESQKPRKGPTKSPATIEKMSSSATARWARERRKTGKLKGERLQRPRKHPLKGHPHSS
jgi:hypothetical protein